MIVDMTNIPGWIRDFPARSLVVPHIQGCDQSIQGQSRESAGLTWLVVHQSVVEPLWGGGGGGGGIATQGHIYIY